MAKDKNVLREGGLLTFKSDRERVDLIDKQSKKSQVFICKVNHYESGFGGLWVACWPLVPSSRVQTRLKLSDF
jgi:hypothetical protein